jgi:hypothetical protein
MPQIYGDMVHATHAQGKPMTTSMDISELHHAAVSLLAIVDPQGF